MSRRYLKIFKTKPITLSLGVTVSTGFQNNKRNKALSLDQLGVQHRTDKASTLLTSGHHRSGHNYLVKYGHFLEHLKLRKDVDILELGAGEGERMGASVKVWAEYFPLSNPIHVAEINPEARTLKTDRIVPRIGDLSDSRFLDKLSEARWDLIIDDASHHWDHQIQALESLFDSVKPGGVYIVEDINTSFDKYRASYVGLPDADSRDRSARDRSDAMTILSEIAYYVSGDGLYHPLLELSTNLSLVEMIGSRVESITFIKGSAILVKSNCDGTYLS